MQHDPGWHIRKIKEGDPEAEAAFRKEYFYPFSQIVRHYTFAKGNISDLMGFRQMVMDKFILYIKCGNPFNKPDGFPSAAGIAQGLILQALGLGAEATL